MTSSKKRWLAAAITCALSTLLAWAGGYNFDERAPWVAFWGAGTLMVAIWVAACPIFSADY